MADAKTEIVVHNGNIVVMNGNIIMGPCDPSVYYVRLMVGNELMDDWWWRVGREKPTRWTGQPGIMNSFYYPYFSGFAPKDVRDAESGGLGWSYSEKNTDETPLGVALSVSTAGYGWYFPDIALHRDYIFLWKWVEPGVSSAHKFNTRPENGSGFEGMLYPGEYILVFTLNQQYHRHTEYVASDTIPGTNPPSNSIVTDSNVMGGCYALYKFIISEAGKDEEGVGGSRYKIDIPGFGNWSQESGAKAQGIPQRGGVSDDVVTNDLDLDGLHLEVVKVSKDKDGNTVEEVVWQSE